MKYSTARREAAEHQKDFAFLVNEEIEKGNTTIIEIADIMGVDRSAACRSLNSQRKMSYGEVVKISQRLGIKPSVWNTIGNPGAESRFLPLYGNVAASVWRVKGVKMPEMLSPIRPIDVGDDNTEEQFCFFVNEGLYAGEYAVCLPIGDLYEPDDGDILIVDETRQLPPTNVEICNTTLKVVKSTEGRKVLVSFGEKPGTDDDDQPFDAYDLKGLVIAFYRIVGKKK